jgi:hypothetical protein
LIRSRPASCSASSLSTRPKGAGGRNISLKALQGPTTTLFRRAPMRATTDGCPSFLPLLLAWFSNSRRRPIAHRHESDIHRSFGDFVQQQPLSSDNAGHQARRLHARAHTRKTRTHTHTHAWCSLTPCGMALRLQSDALYPRTGSAATDHELSTVSGSFPKYSNFGQGPHLG